MSSSSSALPTSVPSVAGQPLLSNAQQSQKGKKRAIISNLWLPLSPFPSLEPDSEDCDKVQHYNTPVDTLSSGQLTAPPVLSWSSGESSGNQLKSVFEDWEDSPDRPNARIIVEEDGTQTLIMTPFSPYFQPPPAPKPFDFAPFSLKFADKDVDAPYTPIYNYDEAPASAETPLTPYIFHRPVIHSRSQNTNKVLLFVDTSSRSLNRNFVLSASLFFSPTSTPDESIGSAFHGPDVPYSVTETSPIERFGEAISTPLSPCLNPIAVEAVKFLPANTAVLKYHIVWILVRAPSPVSDESSTEGPALQGIVQNTSIQERPQAVSPRSAVFSHTSLRTAPMTGRTDALADSKAVVASGSQRHSRRHRDTSGTGSRRKHERDLTHTSASSQRELVKLIIDQEHESSNLRHALATAVQRVQAEAQRVAALEKEKQEAVQRSRILDETRQQAQQEASKATQELRLYTLQLENAQKEIERAQNEAKELQRQRDEAEAEAARAKAKARKLHEETMIAAAREEGRQLGFQAGFEQARRERLAVEARKKKALAQKQAVAKIEQAPPIQPPPVVYERPQMRPQENETYDDDDISVSRLPLKNFPTMHQDPGPSRHARDAREQPRTRQQRSPTEDEYASDRDYPRFHPRQHRAQHQRYSSDPRGYPQPAGPSSRQARPPDPRASPQIQVYSIDIPPQEQLEREFNSREDPNAVLASRPRDEWVTAQKHREIRAPPPHHGPQFPGRYPPPLRVPQQQRPPSQQPAKSVGFLSRGSLKKTKDQAMSWYRSLSRRKNNKPTIDPVPEESPAAVAAASASPAPPTFPVPQVGPAFPVAETVPEPAPAPAVIPAVVPSAASVKSRTSHMQMPVANPAPGSMRAPSQKEASIYGGNTPAAADSSWYPPKSAPSVAQSMRSREPSGRRPASVASTSVSQFALLATPHPGSLAPWMNDDSMREPSQRGGLREKESLLSVIKEDNMSRGHTPHSDRFLPPGVGTSVGGQPAPGMPQPSFGFSQPQFLQHQQSQATMDNRSIRRSNKPPSIMVPDPDAPLEAAGVAYMRAQPDVFGGNGANLARQPSRGSQVTPGSIKIDVVPPSGIAPPPTQSPPHTGKNHLSPYHVFKPPINGLSLAPAQSMLSMRSQKSGRAHPAEYDGGMDAVSRRQSKQSMNMYAINNSQPSRPPSSLGGAFARVAAPFMQHSGSAAAGKSPARSTRLGLHKPESIASFTSRKTGCGPTSMHAQTPRVAPAPVDEVPGPMLMAPQHLRRTGSSTSLRSNTSYSRYNPDEYVDPAFWGVDGPGGAPGALLAAGPDPNGRRSASSDLSYA
ncbi:hypothetical protein CVT24_004267 [Panaeolus cyanescens]|uniref:Uncharacterized protein n=1 Tax=Panaeolus cyanescens TaxID=181874 RepID=A0A409VA99_9AGAR|nr:hypothetical protein CVT24_004267 [Panaeolus cyanescens]